jgi:hypothetical protein
LARPAPNWLADPLGIGHYLGIIRNYYRKVKERFGKIRTSATLIDIGITLVSISTETEYPDGTCVIKKRVILAEIKTIKR